MYELVVVGLGYVGLPLARAAVAAGLRVGGFDTNAPVVASLNAGRSHVDDLSDDDVSSMLERGFSATTDPSTLGLASTIVICVPTPLSDEGGPDLSAVTAAVTTIAEQLRPGTVVILESTTFPGTTEGIVRPLLEQGSGLVAGVDFSLAFSPERVDPGNTTFSIENTPKVVGGLDPRSTEAAREFYARFLREVVVAKGAREAETAKLLENTYRHVNIALVNEMARFCHEMGIDLWDVIRLARTKPFGFEAFYPGPGVGGHCIPIDPNYLSHAVRSALGYPFRFVELAQEINATMPAYVARRVQNSLNDVGKAVRGCCILLLGVTYKPNIADQRESPAVALADQLRALGADLLFHDPYVAKWEACPDVTPVTDLDDAVASADLTILVQHHRDYDIDRLVDRAQLFFDTRGATDDPRAERL
jgi:nucleotide sugar dehydrogenase